MYPASVSLSLTGALPHKVSPWPCGSQRWPCLPRGCGTAWAWWGGTAGLALALLVRNGQGSQLIFALTVSCPFSPQGFLDSGAESWLPPIVPLPAVAPGTTPFPQHPSTALGASTRVDLEMVSFRLCSLFWRFPQMRLSRALCKFVILPLGERGLIFPIFQPTSGKRCPPPEPAPGGGVTRGGLLWRSSLPPHVSSASASSCLVVSSFWGDSPAAKIPAGPLCPTVACRGGGEACACGGGTLSQLISVPLMLALSGELPLPAQR